MPDEFADATRRTRLAAERTWLAWLRTGLTALAVGVGAGRLLPELAGGPTWAYALLGSGFALFGLALLAYGQARLRNVERALDAGRFAPLEGRATLALTVFGGVLAVATIALVLAGI